MAYCFITATQPNNGKIEVPETMVPSDPLPHVFISSTLSQLQNDNAMTSYSFYISLSNFLYLDI